MTKRKSSGNETTYKYKLCPNYKQKKQLLGIFGCVRKIYNWGLERKSEQYKKDKTSLKYKVLAAEMTQLKRKKEFDYLNSCPHECLQQSLKNLEAAFNNFFKKNAKYPKFKSKNKSEKSCKFTQALKIDFERNKLKLIRIGEIKFYSNQIFDLSTCRILSVTVKMDNCGDFWAMVCVDNNSGTLYKKEKAVIKEETAIGIDLGLTELGILSNGEKIENPKYLKKSLKRLEILNQRLAKTELTSNRHKKIRLQIAKLYRKIKNQRLNYLNQRASEITNDYDTICMETLNTKGLIKKNKEDKQTNKRYHMTRGISDASWGMFRSKIEYDAKKKGKNIIFIGQYVPSTKTCHHCGYVNKDIDSLDIREWTCPMCKKDNGRDENAAINIKTIGLRKVLSA